MEFLADLVFGIVIVDKVDAFRDVKLVIPSNALEIFFTFSSLKTVFENRMSEKFSMIFLNHGHCPHFAFF